MNHLYKWSRSILDCILLYCLKNTLYLNYSMWTTTLSSHHHQTTWSCFQICLWLCTNSLYESDTKIKSLDEAPLKNILKLFDIKIHNQRNKLKDSLILNIFWILMQMSDEIFSQLNVVHSTYGKLNRNMTYQRK